MTVRCPKCSTRYRLPPRSTLGRNPTFRCTRCRHVFAADDEAEAPALEELAATDRDVEEGDDAPAFTIEPSPREPDEDDEDVAAWAPRRPVVSARQAGPPSPLRAAVQTAVVVLLVYLVLSIYLHEHPVEARRLLGAIPFIGEEMVETRLRPGHIQLVDPRGDFRRVHGDRLVFVVTATAINNAPVPVAGVQVEGRLYVGDERRLTSQQIVYCGATPKDVSELGIREIQLLQTLKPSADWLLSPGEQGPCLVAFVDPPADLREFEIDVVAVRRTNARTDGPLAKRR
jgi:predicted Zn finger-like uncharacterized protein